MQNLQNVHKSIEAVNQRNVQKKQPFFLKSTIQPKLMINQPNDIYEQEADAVAERVMRMPDTKSKPLFFQPKSLPVIPLQKKCAAFEHDEKLQRKEDEPVQMKPSREIDIQRKCSHCEDEEKVQMKEVGNAGGGMAAPSAVHDVINSRGQSLDMGTRSFMESRFGYDFENVQVHNDSLAHQSSADISALAYTHGNHVVFGAGQYQPNTNQGKQLLAHELAHVVQQRASNTIPIIQRTPGKAGFGTTSTGHSLKVTIKAHASPRWKGAKSQEQADELNLKLSESRAKAAQQLIDRSLKDSLGDDVKISYNIQPPTPRSIDVATGSLGSEESLKLSAGDRTVDDEYYRRVEISFQLFITTTKQVTKSVPPKQKSTITDKWKVLPKRLRVMAAGLGAGGIELVIRNPISNKEMSGVAKLYGGGGLTLPFSETGFSSSGFDFSTDSKIGFSDFNTMIRVETANIKLGVGKTKTYLVFTSLNSGTINILNKWGVGLPGGYVMAGQLQMVGTDPGDSMEILGTDKITVPETKVTTWTEGLIVNFDTASAEINESRKKSISEFVATWSRRLVSP